MQNSVDEFAEKVKALDKEKRWALACYIPIVNIVTCGFSAVIMVKSKFCRFHVQQGLIVFAAWFIANVIIALISPTLSLMALGVVMLIYIAGMISAFKGKEMKIPIIWSFAKMIPEYYIFELLTGKKPEKSNK